MEGSCYKHVHPDSSNVYDFTYWSLSHPGNQNFVQNNLPNPIMRSGNSLFSPFSCPVSAILPTLLLSQLAVLHTLPFSRSPIRTQVGPKRLDLLAVPGYTLHVSLEELVRPFLSPLFSVSLSVSPLFLLFLLFFCCYYYYFFVFIIIFFFLPNVQLAL